MSVSSLFLHSGFFLHDPPVPLSHHLPLLLLLHGWVPLSLAHPVAGLAGRPDAAQPLPNDGGVVLKKNKMTGKERERDREGRVEAKKHKQTERESWIMSVMQKQDEWVTYLSLNNSRHSPQEQNRNRDREGGGGEPRRQRWRPVLSPSLCCSLRQPFNYRIRAACRSGTPRGNQ